MSESANLTYDHIRRAVRHWPPARRFSLAQDILKDIATELPVVEAAITVRQEQKVEKDTLSRALGLLASSSGRAPSDDVVTKWLDERRENKYLS